MEAKHTALPWHCKKLVGVVDRGFALFNTKNSGVTTHRIDSDGEFSKEDALFIIRACNAHDDLVASLEEAKKIIVELCGVYGCPEPGASIARINAALLVATSN